MKNAYLLLTPGPLSTSESVREAMLKDWCTWDDDYNIEIVEEIRRKLVTLATTQSGYTAVLMQGSGTASVEATIGSVMLPTDKLLVIDNGAMGIDFMISSANKCIQGVPGFGFVIAKRSELEQCQGRARSLTLDLYDQWQCMEKNHGKWRFTSPTHTVRAFYQALIELENEGGIAARYQRYQTNQSKLVKGMRELGFAPLLPEKLHSPIITSFYSPEHSDYQFAEFYQRLKQQGFVIYPGKVSHADCFRIGNIGEVYPQDIDRLLCAIQQMGYLR